MWLADTAEWNHCAAIYRGSFGYVVAPTGSDRGSGADGCWCACPPDGGSFRLAGTDCRPRFLSGEAEPFASHIAVYRIVPVRPDAHARFDAISRTYKYYVTTRKDPFNYELVYKIPGKLDFEAMNKACSVLFDYIDFTSFSKLHTDVKTNNCRIYKAGWEREGDVWVFTIQADRFLRNMVRAIVGTLLEVGRGKLTVDGFRQVIEAKDRGRAGTSAPGHALYLVDVTYPEELFQLAVGC